MRLDEIVYKVYGNLNLFEAVLEKNTHLHGKNILDAGDVVNLVELPKITEAQNKEENLKALW
jgi:phage tail protein X